MRQFISFVKKEFYHIFRDKRTMLILLGIPVVQMLLFGFAITTEVKDVQVAVFDPSKDVATRQIIEKFRASSYFDFVEELTDVDEINDIFKYGKINLVIVFSDNFAENLMRTGDASVQLITDGTEPNQASMITGYASNILASYQQSLSEQRKTPFRIVPEIKMLFNPQSESAYNFVPGVMGMILMLICAMMTSIAIVREKETGTMEVLLASPMRPIFIILAKAVPYFVLSILNLITILLLSVFVLGVPVAGNIFSLMFISLVFIFLALSLGLLISTLVDTQMAAILASGMGLMMPTMILSGLVFPLESMPVVLQWISAIVPARWYIEAIRKIMIQGVGIEFVMRELGVLAVMTCLLLVLSLKKFKTRLS
ncbi:MAG TPA: multidrug ABC transporter permease [Porphyromonadaceae bacterium]|nr:multidrug ABC transporter permease [Porphyromonadaceae bacterium]